MNAHRRVLVMAVLAAVTLTAGCTGRHGGPAAAVPVVTPSPVSVPAVQMSASSAPTGTLLVAMDGTGPRDFPLPVLARGHSLVTLRLACVGPGTADVTNTAGVDVLSIGGCDGTAIYSGVWTSKAVDDTLTLTVAAGCNWRVAIWADPK